MQSKGDGKRADGGSASLVLGRARKMSPFLLLLVYYEEA
jgi:hypothetical protein